MSESNETNVSAAMMRYGLLPCDRGAPGGERGFHHFEASPYGAVCVYCGKRGPSEPIRVTHSVSRPTQDLVDRAASVWRRAEAEGR